MGDHDPHRIVALRAAGAEAINRSRGSRAASANRIEISLRVSPSSLTCRQSAGSGSASSASSGSSIPNHAAWVSGAAAVSGPAGGCRARRPCRPPDAPLPAGPAENRAVLAHEDGIRSLPVLAEPSRR